MSELHGCRGELGHTHTHTQMTGSSDACASNKRVKNTQFLKGLFLKTFREVGTSRDQGNLPNFLVFPHLISFS